MIDATEMMQQYRLALRHIWNEYIWRNESLRLLENILLLKEFKVPLFNILIGSRLDLPQPGSDQVFGGIFLLVPSNRAADKLSFPSVMIDLEPPGGFRSFVGPFKKESVEFVLLDFFDWQKMDYRDFQYYSFLVRRFDDHPDLVGRSGLIEVAAADVVLDDQTPKGRAGRA